MIYEDKNHKWHYYIDINQLDRLALDEGIKHLRWPLFFAIVYITYALTTL